MDQEAARQDGWHVNPSSSLPAGRKFKTVFGADAQQARALLNWGRVLVLRADLVATDPEVQFAASFELSALTVLDQHRRRPHS